MDFNPPLPRSDNAKRWQNDVLVISALEGVFTGDMWILSQAGYAALTVAIRSQLPQLAVRTPFTQ